MTKVTSTNEYPRVQQVKSKTPLSKPNIKYAKPLYYISLMTGLSCPINLNRYTAKSGIEHKVYSLVMVGLLIYGSIVDFLGRLDSAYVFLIHTVKITDIIQQASLLISNAYAILNVFGCGEVYIKKYFQMIKQIDENLITTMNLKRNRIQFYSTLIIAHLIFIGLCVYDYWTWSSTVGFNVFKFYILRLYEYYLNIVIVLQLYMFSTALQMRFVMLNERLFDVTMKWIGNLQSNKAIAIRDLYFSYKKSSIPVDTDGLSLTCVVRMHDLLCDIIELLNDAFGFNVVMLVFNIILNSVIALNLTLVFGSGLQPITGLNHIHLIALNISWAILFLTMGAFIAKSCDDASKEAWKTATIAYKLLTQVPLDSCITKEREIRIELTQLAMQVEHRRPNFNAWGFFAINNTMLYAIIGAISSYIVIIIQFNNSQFLPDSPRFNSTNAE